MNKDGELKNRLLVLRAERGWSQQDVASMIGVSRQTINSLEKNKYNPSLKLAFMLANLFEADINNVFQFEKDS